MPGPAPYLLDIAPLTQRLEVINVDDQRTIFLNGYLAGRYACNDKGTERIVVTQLAEVLSLPDRQIAAAFQLHPVTLSRFRGLARSGGCAALVPLKTGPKGPSKMTPKLQARCRALRKEGLSFRAIAERVSGGNRTISYVTVAALLKGEAEQPQQPALPLEAEADTPAREAEAVPEAGAPPSEAATPGECRYTRYAGAMMLYAALGRLGLWEVFQDLGASIGAARQFGWAQTVADYRILLRLALSVD